MAKMKTERVQFVVSATLRYSTDKAKKDGIDIVRRVIGTGWMGSTSYGECKFQTGKAKLVKKDK